MYQSAEFITDLIFETESMGISDPESPLKLPWESYKNHFRRWQRSIQQAIDAGQTTETGKIKIVMLNCDHSLRDRL